MSHKRDLNGTQEPYSDADVHDLRAKWLSLPMGITTVLVAGSVLNLMGYFLKIKDELGFEPFEQELVRWAVAGGYYGGIFAGPVVSILGNKVGYLASAVVSLIGFIILGFYTDSYFVGTLSSITIISLLGIVSFGGAIATIASIATVVKNFTRNVGSLVIAVMITYYMIAPYFEKGIRSGFLLEHSFKSTLIYGGVFQFITYVAAAFFIKEVELSPRIQKSSSLVDAFGLSIFIIVEAVFITVIYFSCIIAGKWRVGAFLMLILIIVNFLACAFTVWLLLNKIKEADVDNIDIQHSSTRRRFGEVLTKPGYYGLLISSFVIAGSCTAFQLEAPTVAFAMGVPERGFNVMKTFWVSDVLTRFGGGIIAALFSRVLNPYLFAALAAFSGMFGFAIALLTEPAGGAFFYIASLFIGGAVGAIWVVVPQIILNEGGTKVFETLWGMVISINLLGVFAFDKVFMWIGDKEEPYEVGTGQGFDCYLASFIISSVLGGFAGAICLFGYSNNIGPIPESNETSQPIDEHRRKKRTPTK